ncbi:hypothetical protein F4808DRAFT_273115 [Astrocystis sublimbata]|nr:hypothetical protein F4808DRAFT_273115 [Astrocystis sublimbata]
MDRDWQEVIFESWTDTEVVLKQLSSIDPRGTPSPVKTPTRSTTTSIKLESPELKKLKGEGTPTSESKKRTEPPSPRTPISPFKRRPVSTRPSSIVTLRSPFTDDLDGKSRRSRVSVCDTSSIHTFDTSSNDERRLSSKVKKAWRGVRGQRLDPLEEWMVKHSGGTLREAPPAGRESRESSDKQ